MRVELNSPVMLADGRFGLIIRVGVHGGAIEAVEMVGVQVPDEEDVRWVGVDRLRDDGGGALREVPGGPPKA